MSVTRAAVLDQLSVLKLVTGRLDAAGIACMVTGSIAAGHYGQPRMTREIDVVVQLNLRDADRLVAMPGAELTGDADMTRSAIAHRSMFNVIQFVHSSVVIRAARYLGYELCRPMPYGE